MVQLLKLAWAAALATSPCSAADVFEQATINDCLEAAKVPFNEKNTTAWNQDVKPFNLRLPYIPTAIAVPRTTEHIRAAVKCGVSAGVRVSAKAGGHSYSSFGFGGEDGQLVIELDRMFNVTLRKDNTATIQGGARLGHVAVELAAQGGRAIAHGTCPGVGLSGHGLHGGYGMAAHSHGLTLDWMTGATVVLANATVVHCSKTENADLFWALRGAGSSFGIVAEYEFDTFAAPSVATYYQVNTNWNETQTVKGFQALQNWAANDMPRELNMRLALDANSLTWEGVYYGNKTQLQNELRPILNATGATLASSTNTTWIKGLEHFAYGFPLNQTTPYDQHETFYSTSLTTPALTPEQIKSFISYKFHNASVGSGFTRRWWIQIDLHGGKNSAISQVLNSDTAYAHRDQLFLYQFYDSIFSGSYPKDGFSLLQNFVKSITGTLEKGQFGKYINYADSQLAKKDANELYWRDNLARLKTIKKKYDPGEVFWNPSSIEPAA